jgi:hypothetical protein
VSFSKISLVKMVASGIVGMGASKIAGQIIKNNVAAPTNLIERVMLAAGAWGIGGIVAQSSRDHTNDVVDKTVSAISKIINDMKNDAKLSRINKGTSTFEAEGLDETKFEKVNDVWTRVEPVEDKPDVEFKDGDIIITKDGVKTRVKEVDNGLWAVVVD